MPFGKSNDYERNPHFLSGGVATILPADFHWDASDCTGASKPGGETYLSHTGLFITARILPIGKFHRFRVKAETDPRRANFNFMSEDTALIACISPPNFYPERVFNQGNAGRIFVYAGSFRNPPGPACFHPDIYRPIRGCPTAYGWFIEVDSGGTDAYDMTIYFIEGP
jgi:hypothetical protein